MPHDVLLLPGVGPVTAKRLALHGVYTVQDLAKSNLGDDVVKNAQVLRERAMQFLSQHGSSRDTTKVKRHLIANHSWFECPVALPIEDEHGTVKLRRAIVYELSVETYNRISFICSYFEETCNRQILCNFTKSALFILTFNMDALPPLEITLGKRDFTDMANNYVLYDMVREVNAVQTLKCC